MSNGPENPATTAEWEAAKLEPQHRLDVEWVHYDRTIRRWFWPWAWQITTERGTYRSGGFWTNKAARKDVTDMFRILADATFEARP